MLSEIVENLKISSLKREAKSTPTFIFMMGGTGAGKNYIYRKYLDGVPLIDIDEYTKEFAKQYDTDPRKQVSRATVRSKRELLDSFSKKKSIVQMGTGNNIKSTSNKFKWAKDAGMKVVVVLVDVEPEVALKRNRDRHAGGEERLVPDEKVVRTVKVAKENAKLYTKDPNIDEVIVVKN